MQHLVIGLGEVGKSLRSVLHCEGYDLMEHGNTKEQYDMLHICIPYGPEFIKAVKGYQERFKPTYTVIHSTVPIGTSQMLGACHSPVRGKHPNLSTSLLVFRKYVGGPQAWEVAKELKKFEIPAIPLPHADDTEAGKLLDLYQYAVSIMLEKEIHSFCKKYGIDFDVAYTQFNQTYNDGYRHMREAQFVRPVLKHVEGRIGGHCVLQNMAHLDMDGARRIISDNAKL